MSKAVHVAVGVIYNSQGKVLIALRPNHTHLGGLWEFPGGKVEVGEKVQAALIRELNEELGIDTTASTPWIKIRHTYPDVSVLLDVWRVTEFQGEALGREGQDVRWVSVDELSDYHFPAPNLDIVKLVQSDTSLIL